MDRNESSDGLVDATAARTTVNPFYATFSYVRQQGYSAAVAVQNKEPPCFDFSDRFPVGLHTYIRISF